MTIFTAHGPGSWTDIIDKIWAKAPNIIIKANEMNEFFEGLAEQDINRLTRELIYYCPVTGNKYRLECVFYVHPAVADITLHIAGVSQVEGRFILNAGTLAGARAETQAIAGMLFPFYYTTDSDTFLEELLEAGDGIWVVRRGQVELANDNVGATADGDVVVTGASGGGDIGTAIGAGYAQAAAEDNAYGRKFCGNWKAIVASGAVGRADLNMPPRYTTP